MKYLKRYIILKNNIKYHLKTTANRRLKKPLANSSISLQGIDQTIADLKYRPGSVKQKIIMAIRDFYPSDESIKELDFIDTDTLIKSIWDIGDNFSKIKSKRRNFSSLRSSINVDLKKLLKKEKNSRNIIIADSNVFDLTKEAKEDLLGSLSNKRGEDNGDRSSGHGDGEFEELEKVDGLVINSLFEIFIKETGYITSAEKLGFGRVYYLRFKKDASGSKWIKNSGSEDVKGACWYQPTGPDSSLHGKRNHPVVQVSVDDALTFASWIGRRIPTEAEWESAARTDMGYKYPWGNEFNQKALNMEQNGLTDTSPVDRYKKFANGFKVIVMLGNVMEWTSDMEIPTFKSKQNTRYSVAKGGAWNARDGVTIRSRALFKPGFTSNTIGFRCI